MWINLFFKISIIYMSICCVFGSMTTIRRQVLQNEKGFASLVTSSCRLPSTSSPIDGVCALGGILLSGPPDKDLRSSHNAIAHHDNVMAFLTTDVSCAAAITQCEATQI